MAISATCSDRSRLSGVLRIGAAGAIGALLLGDPRASIAQAAGTGPLLPFRLQSALDVSETYSDNIELAPSGQERSDLVTTISPSIVIVRRGPRLSLNLNYAPQALFYANGTRGADIRNNLFGTVNAEVLKELFFVDAFAQISQQNISPFGPLAADSVNSSDNRAETRTVSINPYFRSRADSVAYQFGYRYIWSDYSNDVLSRTQTNGVYANASGPLPIRNLTWAADFDRQQQNYRGLRGVRTQTVSGTISYLYSPRLTLFVVGGHDSNTYPTFANESTGGAYYSAGFSWAPTPTTSVNAQHGHRYFGSTDQIDINHRTQLTAWRASYTNGQTSTSQLLAAPADLGTAVLLDNYYLSRYPDPVARAAAVNDLLQRSIQPNGQITQFNFLSNQIFRQKRLDLSLVLLGKRNTVTFSFSRSEDESLSNQDVPLDIFAGTSAFRQDVASVFWSYNLGPRTTATFSAQSLKSSASDGNGQSSQRIFTAAVQRQLQARLNATLSFRNTRQSGTGLASAYKENQIIAAAHLQF